MSAVLVGMIAEDQSDIDVLKQLGRSISGRNFSVAPHYGKGCGHIKAKTPGWCAAFAKKGCKAIVLVHDRDKKDAEQLRNELEDILLKAASTTAYIAIPSEELEAWLLSDTQAIKAALKLEKAPKEIHHPETITSPKEYLGDLVEAHSKNKAKQYVNTEHNKLIAREINISAIASKCPSFEPFKAFIETEVGKPATKISKRKK